VTIPSVDWWITSRCNLACDFCYGPEPGRDPISLRKDILAAIEASSTDTVTLCGGEPLVVRELAVYAQHLASHQKRVVLNTNGLLLRRLFDDSDAGRRHQKRVVLNVIGPLLRHLFGGRDADFPFFPFDVVGLSIEGPTDDVHRAMRGPKADLTEVLAAADFVSKRTQTRLKVATVVSAVNAAHLEELAELVRERIKPDVWRLYQYSSRGPANKGQARHTIGPEEFTRLAENAAKRANPVPVLPSSEDTNVGCLIVDASGDVLQPNGDGYQRLGNCLEQPIDEIWQSVSDFAGMVAENKRWLSMLPA
jgi:MoaA/NifB/PqqE/SkfB family radical SAM enzyme